MNTITNEINEPSNIIQIIIIHHLNINIENDNKSPDMMVLSNIKIIAFNLQFLSTSTFQITPPTKLTKTKNQTIFCNIRTRNTKIRTLT